MICYLDSCRDKVLKLCTPQKFTELTESQRTAMLIDAYRNGENPNAKSQLPAFVFMGCDPKMLSEGAGYGSRKKSDLVPTGLVMFDFDHISKTVFNDEGALTPRDLYDRFLKLMPHFGFTLENDLALAHITPSGDGLRIVMRIRNGKTIAETQKRVGEMLGIECDKAVKDLSRLSFCPKSEDILYMNKNLLFGRNTEPKTTNHQNNQTTNGDNTTEKDAARGNGGASGGRKEVALCHEGRELATDLQSGATLQSADGGAEQHSSIARPSEEHGGCNEGGMAQEGVSEARPSLYHGVPYASIVEKWIELRGGKPEIGDRHATLIELAMDLRKICDNDKEWIASLMPDFDKGEQEKMDCIEWAVNRQHSKISGTLLQVLQDFNIITPELKAPADSSLFTFHSSLSEQSEDLPPAMPEELPSLVRLLTSKVLNHQKPAVASMIFPALAAHVNNCRFRLRDNTDVELSLMCCLLAQQSVGKGCVKPPLKLIMRDIKAQDRVNRQRERQWQEEQKNKKANEKGKSRPDDIVIRILSSDTTPAAFLGRLMAAENGDGENPNLCTYSQVDEIEDLYRFCASGGKNMVQQMIKRTWDRDDIGAERWSANSANISTVLRWNWAASSTVEGGKKFFRNCLTDGTTSRVDFCTIIPPNEVIDFCYGDYDEDFENALRPYIDNLKRFACKKTSDGTVIPCLFPEVRALEEEMNQHINDTSSAMPDSTWENYAWRAKVMAIKKLIVLYIANGCKWEQTFEPFVWWSFHYSMWSKMNLFYDAASEAFKDEQLRGQTGQRTPLKEMPRSFTLAQFAQKCQEFKVRSTPRNLLAKFKSRGIVAQNGDSFVMNPEWAKKNGII